LTVGINILLYLISFLCSYGMFPANIAHIYSQEYKSLQA